MTIEELHGTLSAYEMRIVNDRLSGKEVDFKAPIKNKDSNYSEYFDKEQENL